MLCPGHISTTSSTQEKDSESSNSTFEFDDLEACDPPTHESVNGIFQDILNGEHSTSSSESESSSDINCSGPEVWDETDECSSDSEMEATESFRISQLTYFVCPFSSCVFIF